MTSATRIEIVAADQSLKRIELLIRGPVGHEVPEPAPRFDDVAAELSAETCDYHLDRIRIAVIAGIV